MEDLWLSASILSLKRTLTEKIVLARICQQAARRGGYCIDTNKELAQAVGLHHQTVSDTVGRLSEGALLTTGVVSDKSDQSNQRTLSPSAGQLGPYKSLAYGVAQVVPKTIEPPKSSAYKAKPAPSTRAVRLCPITAVDITHQRPNAYLATNTTLRMLFAENRVRFDELVAQFLTPGQAAEVPSSLSFWLTVAIRRQAAKKELGGVR